MVALKFKLYFLLYLAVHLFPFFQKKISLNVEDILARTQITLKTEKVPTNIDTENPTSELLPPPIIPQVQKSKGIAHIDLTKSFLPNNYFLSPVLKVVAPALSAHQDSDKVQVFEKEGLTLPGITKYAFPSDSELDALGADSVSGEDAVALPMSDSQEFLLTPSSTYGFSSLDELTTPDELCAAQASLSFVQVSIKRKCY